MFGESNTPSSIGPSRRGLWRAVATWCLILATATVLVSGTVDGLNFFGWHLPDSTPKFSDPPKDDESPKPERSTPPTSKRSPGPVPPKRPNALIPSRPPAPTPRAAATAVVRTSAPARPPAQPPCTLSGFAALLEPANDPIGTALARSLHASDLRARVIELGDANDATEGAEERLVRRDVDRIMAGDGSSVARRITEGTLLVAQLKVQVRQTVIDEAPMTEVAGTMDLAIVRNNCGAITVQRHRNVFGRSVNETLDDGIRGLGEIFKEKIADLVRRSSGEKQ